MLNPFHRPWQHEILCLYFLYLNEFIKFADMDKLGLILIRPDGHIALRALPNKDNKNILTNYFEEIGF
ncbi:hypothetical protein N9C67_06370 [Gammaproteobacteria bacterium]|nr:hypothetical protein [Gammaproteobacteria bacterium]